MSLRKKFRIFLKVVISLACLVVCAYQCYIVGVLYLSYPTTVDLRIARSLNVHLPGVTICSEIATTILPEKIIEIQPSLYQYLHGRSQREISYLLRKRTFRQLLEEPLRRLPIHLQHKQTISAKKFFDKCDVPTPIGYQKGFTYSYTKINCSAIAKIIETISYDKKCFTLFHNNDENYNPDSYKINRDSAANLKYLAWIRINRDYVLNGLLYIHSPKEMHQYSDGNNVLQLHPTKDQFIAASFTRQTTTLLPPPYATKCRNYTLDGFSSREHCLAQCKINIYTNADGWPGDIFATKDVSYTFSNLWMNSKSPSGHLEEGLSVDQQCRKTCGDFEDCYNVFYDVKQLRVEERDEEDFEQQQWLTIGILPPKAVDMSLVHLPKYEPIEFAIYIGGLISLYLGVSVVSVIVALFAFITFTGKPFDRKTKSNKSGDKSKGIQMTTIPKQIRTNGSDIENNNNNNRFALIPSKQSHEERIPRAKLPGILHFMFEI